MKKPQLVVVDWVDTTTYSMWDYEIDDETLSNCCSVGWLIKKDRFSVVLASMRDNDKRKTSNMRTHIPRGCIRNIRKIE